MSRNRHILKAVGVFLALTAFDVQAERNGEIKVVEGERQVYLADESIWVTPESFWQSYSESSSGKHWGSSETYPPYNDVNEFDTFTVEIGSGTCLMEFFHSRWRRANDVRRWDPQFNEHSACPVVFD